MNVTIPNSDTLKQIKKALAASTFGIGSGHLSEILAAGLSYRTSISLQSALKAGTILARVDDAAAVARQQELAPEGTMPAQPIRKAIEESFDPITLWAPKSPADDPSTNLVSLIDAARTHLMWPDLVRQVTAAALPLVAHTRLAKPTRALADALNASVEGVSKRRVPVDAAALRQLVRLVVEHEVEEDDDLDATEATEILMTALAVHSAALCAGHSYGKESMRTIIQGTLWSGTLTGLSIDLAHGLAQMQPHQDDFNEVIAQGLIDEREVEDVIYEWWHNRFTPHEVLGSYWDALGVQEDALDEREGMGAFCRRRAAMCMEIIATAAL